MTAPDELGGDLVRRLFIGDQQGEVAPVRSDGHDLRVRCIEDAPV